MPSWLTIFADTKVAATPIKAHNALKAPIIDGFRPEPSKESWVIRQTADKTEISRWKKRNQWMDMSRTQLGQYDNRYKLQNGKISQVNRYY